MKSESRFPWLSRWNRRAVMVFSALLFAAWILYFVLGVFAPLSTLDSIVLRMVLPFGVLFLLFIVWLTILISPGLPGTGNPAKESAWRLAAAAFCLGLLATVMSVGGGPLTLGLRAGGSLGIGLQPVRDLQASPDVKALAQSREGGLLPREQWPASLAAWDRLQVVQVFPGAQEESPRLLLGFGRAGTDVMVQPEQPDDTDAFVAKWADGIWMVRRNGE